MLTGETVDLASGFVKYGYRRVTALLRHRGWDVNHKRVERYESPVSEVSWAEH